MKNLLDRIDVALQAVGLTRQELCTGVGITPQALSNLKRRPGSALIPETMARIARFARCDFFWLCTGEGGEYMSSEASYSPIALRVANWIDNMSEADRMRAVGHLAAMREGVWPSTPPVDMFQRDANAKRNGKRKPPPAT